MITLDTYEYCFLVEPTHYLSAQFKVRLPKLVPNGSNTNTISTSNFNKKIFVNTTSPTVSNISTQNFLTVPRSTNCSLFHLANPLTGIIPKGTRFRCNCYNNNINDLTIIDG